VLRIEATAVTSGNRDPRGSVPEHEEQDDQRAESADERLTEDRRT